MQDSDWYLVRIALHLIGYDVHSLSSKRIKKIVFNSKAKLNRWLGVPIIFVS